MHDRDQAAGTFEFKGTSYEHQLARFSKGQALAREKLGFPFRVFGAPYNQTDQTTREILKTDPDLRVWLYGPSGETGLVVLPRVVNFEVSTGKINYDAFVAQYAAKREAGVLVLQAHPGNWKTADFDAFVRIVAFLREQGVRFVNPSDHVAAL